MANKEIFKKLQALRLAKNYSYEDMANKLQVSKSFYWQIENQKRRLTYDMAIKIGKIFKKKPDVIFYEDFLEKEEAN